MIIGIVKETQSGETRVAGVPETVSVMVKKKFTVLVEKEAGKGAYIADQRYIDAGATIEADARSVLSKADIVFKVHRPIVEGPHDEMDLLQDKAILIAPLFAQRYPAQLKKLNDKKISAFALELLPRIARAQSMDILSSMSNLAGYKSVILAADYLPKIFPMMTTAAGTIPPVKVIVIGAGVAGLQAIATARRLGAVVIGFDTRPVTEEQVKSLGANFVSMAVSHEQSEDAGGYAKEQSQAFYQQEQDILRKYTKEADVIITTALVPGKRAPLLITEEMVKEMQQGSVIVDLAAEQDGNCALSEPGKIVVKHGVSLIALTNLPSLVSVNASQLLAKNMLNFLNYITPQMEAGQFDRNDEIIKNCLITYDGQTVHPGLKG